MPFRPLYLVTLRRRAMHAAFLTLPGLLTWGCEQPAPPGVAPPTEVSVSLPVQRTVTDSIDYTGTTAALEQVEVRARVTGFLQQVHFAAQQRLERGALLFTIDKDPFLNAVNTAKATLNATRAQLDKAEHDAVRVKDLFDKGASSSEELRDIISKRDSLKAMAAANDAQLAQAQLELSWCEVRAPIAGRVGRQLLDPGNIVVADKTVLTEIVNDDQIYVYFNVSEHDILTIRAAYRAEEAASGQPAASQPALRDIKWPVQIGLMTEEGFPHRGYLDYSAPALDPATGTQQVRAVFPNADGVLLGGLFVRIHIPIGRPYSALTVTERALGSDQGQRYVLVVNNQNVVEYRPVTVGTLSGGMRVITQGLKADDRVIVVGIQRVRPGLTVKPVEVPMPDPTLMAATPAAEVPQATPEKTSSAGH